MIPLDLYNIRQGLNLTKQDLDKHLEVDHGTVNRWELKKEPIPRWASLAVRYLATDRVPQEGDWDFVGAIKPKFSLPVYPRVDAPELQEIHMSDKLLPPKGHPDYLGENPAVGVDIGVRDIEGDETYTEEEQMKLWSRCANVVVYSHRRTS